MTQDQHTLLICMTCGKNAADMKSRSSGAKLYSAVREILSQQPADPRYDVVGVECMSVCNRPCTVAFSGPGKPTYLFGDLSPDAETAAQSLELLISYCNQREGILERNARPALFRKGILARIPSADDRRDSQTTATFDDAFRKQLHDLFAWRRDVRRFRSDPVPPETLKHLLEITDLAPSVGLSQPWRFVFVESAERRDAVRQNFENSNREALAAMPEERAGQYARLKLAGLDEAPCQFAVFAEAEPEKGHGLGRRTMPETLNYSTVMAVHTLWLAARTVGLGLGWVSILDPVKIAETLDVPPSWNFIGYFCLGYPQEESLKPELTQLGWEQRSITAPNYLTR